MRRFLLTLACLLFSFNVLFTATAKAGLLEFFFPSLREEEYDPYEKMVAPFALGQGAEEKEILTELPVNSAPLSQPHRVLNEIAVWTGTQTGEAMNFETNDLTAETLAHVDVFDAAARAQYQKFLQDMSIGRVVESPRYEVRSHVEGVPLMVNEGLIKGRYRWLFTVPVLMTYMDRNSASYTGAVQPITQRATINVQVGRIDVSDDTPDGLQIEQWSGKVEPMIKDAKTEE